MTRHPAFPISLYVTGRKVLVVGDGAGANRRADALRACGGNVTQTGQAGYEAASCQGAFLVVAQTDDPDVDAQIAADARAAGAIAYAHDLPDRSDFAMAAIARRGPLAIAVSTDAVAPALSRRMREQLDALLESGGPELDALIAELEAARARLPRGERGVLYNTARRVRIDGSLVVDDEDL